MDATGPLLAKQLYVYNTYRNQVFMTNTDWYKDRGEAEVYITSLC